MTPSTLLREARRRVGISQRELARRADVPQSTVGRIEAGLLDPRFGTLEKLLRSCGYEIETERKLGEGVDRTQIRELLALSPRDRIVRAAAAARGVRRISGRARKRK